MRETLREVDEILQKYGNEIPFGNSDVQDLAILPADCYSPGRKLRAYLLRLYNRKRSLDHYVLQLREQEIKIRKLERQLEKETDDLEKELIQVKIEQILVNVRHTYKLYIDCLREITTLVTAIKTEFPEPISREEFERQELEHFKEKLVLQLKQPSQFEALQALGFEVQVLPNGDIKAIPVPELQAKIENLVAKAQETFASLPIPELPKLPYYSESRVEEEGGSGE